MDEKLTGTGSAADPAPVDARRGLWFRRGPTMDFGSTLRMVNPDHMKARASSGKDEAKAPARRDLIAAAAIAILAEHGVAGLTHRRVAAAAGVPLAATTYYFATKFDIVAAASAMALRRYGETLASAAASLEAPADFPHFVRQALHAAAGQGREDIACWAEVAIDAPRHAETRAMASSWSDALTATWRAAARASQVPDVDSAVRSASDLFAGLMMMVLALGVSARRVDEALGAGDLLVDWRPEPVPTGDDPAPLRKTRKAAATRQQVIDAAISILRSDGAAALSYRAIAVRAGVTPAGPFYHFPTIDGLLTAAERHLFEASKQRYREAAVPLPADLDALIDRTADVFVREANEQGGANVAGYAIWLQASRRPEVRQMVWEAIADQHVAWLRALKVAMVEPKPLDALIAQALFAGKMVRVLATGSRAADLALVRGEFAVDFSALAAGRFWLQIGTID